MLKVVDFVVSWVDGNDEIYLNNSSKINCNLYVIMALIFVTFCLKDMLKMRRSIIIGQKKWS